MSLTGRKMTWGERQALLYVAANEGRQGMACRLSRISETTRQRLIDLVMNYEPPLVDTNGDFVCLTEAGRSALANPLGEDK